MWRQTSRAAAPGHNEGLKRDKTLVSFQKFITERPHSVQIQFRKEVIAIINIIIYLNICQRRKKKKKQYSYRIIARVDVISVNPSLGSATAVAPTSVLLLPPFPGRGIRRRCGCTVWWGCGRRGTRGQLTGRSARRTPCRKGCGHKAPGPLSPRSQSTQSSPC